MDEPNGASFPLIKWCECLSSEGYRREEAFLKSRLGFSKDNQFLYPFIAILCYLLAALLNCVFFFPLLFTDLGFYCYTVLIPL